MNSIFEAISDWISGVVEALLDFMLGDNDDFPGGAAV